MDVCLMDKTHAKCSSCKKDINDKYIMLVSPDLPFHASCLACSACGLYLNEHQTCFVKSDKPFCKRDYLRLFGPNCASCHEKFMESDSIMRIRDQRYHLNCFVCDVCSCRLLPGHQFANHDNRLLCSFHFSGFEKKERETDENPQNISFKRESELETETRVSAQSDSKALCTGAEISYYSCVIPSKKRRSVGKTTRIRTVLNEKQLQILRDFYTANPRPDAFMKEQLVEMTGLSSRVIRVWFQNKRCKDKKREIISRKHFSTQPEGISNLIRNINELNDKQKNCQTPSSNSSESICWISNFKQGSGDSNVS